MERETCVCAACETMNPRGAYERYGTYAVPQEDGSVKFGAAFRRAAARDGWEQLVNHAGFVRRCGACQPAFLAEVEKYGRDPKLIEVEAELKALSGGSKR